MLKEQTAKSNNQKQKRKRKHIIKSKRQKRTQKHIIIKRLKEKKAIGKNRYKDK